MVLCGRQTCQEKETELIFFLHFLDRCRDKKKKGAALEEGMQLLYAGGEVVKKKGTESDGRGGKKERERGNNERVK